MKLVRHFPVAEQYPSITARTSAFASNLISGTFAPRKKKSRTPAKAPGKTVENHGGGEIVHASSHSRSTKTAAANCKANGSSSSSERCAGSRRLMRETPSKRPAQRRQRRTQSRRESRARSRKAGGSCCCLIGVAKHRPINVRAKVLASDEAVGGPLDCRAAFGWRLPYSVGPLAQKHGRYPAEPFRQLCGWSVLV